MLKWKLKTKVDFWRGYNAIRPSVRTDSVGGGRASQYKPNRGAQQRHLFLEGNSFGLLCQQTIAEVDLTFSR